MKKTQLIVRIEGEFFEAGCHDDGRLPSDIKAVGQKPIYPWELSHLGRVGAVIPKGENSGKLMALELLGAARNAGADYVLYDNQLTTITNADPNHTGSYSTQADIYVKNPIDPNTRLR